jgi:5'-3' exonuclease
MGIPFYFASLIKTHSGIVRSLKGKHQTDILCFDFNCLIHRYLDENNPIQSILRAFQMILNDYCQAKIIYVAFDGLVPYAKIVQQRYRRMCLKEVSGNFDRNQISPGTPYMLELEEAMKLRFPQIIISGTHEPGEGEHKIIQFLQHSQKNKSITIYGLDADLILICLQHHKLSLENSMFLLRESSEMGEKEEFAIMDIWKLFLQLPIDIYQYIALSIMCFGNDFMPSLGIFSLREDGYNRALQFYEKSKNPNLLTIEGRKVFLNYVALEEQRILKERILLRRRSEEKYVLGKDNLFNKKYYLHVLDGVINPEKVVEAYWKTFSWSLEYFTKSSPPNWDWYYPYSDAPLITDIVKFPQSLILDRKPLNFKILNQLQFILPKTSLRKAKKLVKFPDETYTDTRNPWMKRFDWEMKPRISLPWNPTHSLTSISPLKI